MPYYSITPETDSRFSAQGATPLILKNCMVEKSPKGSARRSRYFIVPTPGRTLRATLQDNCRGLFSEPGCRDGKLFAPAGAYFNEVTSVYGYTSQGTLTGSDNVVMVPFRDDVAALSNASIKHWDGTTFSTVNDADAPAAPSTLASVAYRLVAAEAAGDGFGWSGAGTFNTWPTDGAAADIYLPDPIVGQFEIGGDLWSFNSRSTQIWQATGGAESEAFALVPGAAMRVGLAARDAIARVGDGAMFLGHDRRVYRTNGMSAVPVENRDLEVALKALTASDIAADARAYSYRKGAKEYWALTCGLERGFFYDVDLGLWHERAKYGAAEYDIHYAATAFEESVVVVGGSATAVLWTLEDEVYTDAGTQIVREMSVHVPVSADVPVDRIVIDGEWYDQPLSGQGSAPTLLLSVSVDGGATYCDERSVNLPAQGTYNVRVQDWAFGLASAERGVIIRVRLSDPIGFSIWGVFVNPGPDEVP